MAVSCSQKSLLVHIPISSYNICPTQIDLVQRQRKIVGKTKKGGGLMRVFHCEILDEIITRDGLKYNPIVDFIGYFNDNNSYICDTNDESDDESDIKSDDDKDTEEEENTCQCCCFLYKYIYDYVELVLYVPNTNTVSIIYVVVGSGGVVFCY